MMIRDLEYYQNRRSLFSSSAPAGEGGAEPTGDVASAGGGGGVGDAGPDNGSGGPGIVGGETPPAPPPSDFASLVASLPADLRDAPGMGDIKTFDGLVKSYLHSQSLIGKERFSMPGDESSPEEWNSFYESLGRPANPEGYQFPQMLDESYREVHGEMIGKMTEAMHAAGLNPKQANQIAETFVRADIERDQAMDSHAQETLQANEQVLREKWGLAYDANIERVNEAARKMFGEGEALDNFRQIRLADGSYLGDNLLMVQMLAHLGDSIGEGDIPPPGAGAHTPSPDQAQMEMAELRQNPAWLDRDHPDHRRIVQRLTDLQRYAHPDRAGASTIMEPKL